MDELLEKLRLINQMLQKEGGFINTAALQDGSEELPFQEMTKVLAGILEANVYLIDVKGDLLGFSEAIDINNARVKQMLVEKKFPLNYANDLAGLSITTANIGIESDITVFPIETRDIFVKGLTTITPIFAAGKRLGSLIFARIEPSFDSGDLILAEHSGAVMGIEMLHLMNLKTEAAAKVDTSVEIALKSMSYSELKAAKEIFKTISDLDTLINASKIAAKNEITRSVIVNALRKMESAGILESKSLGMKGTHIRVFSSQLLEAIKQKLQRE
ncbi:GTP-sensing pleiotropic transcriptional regulator CodY [Jeotgalibaca sp. MA1X17-3]|uniref:GTP-sensing pleiotropic transcriptional regulator CodY n=1 Tax=Jeotgalibaca sp. MA1X17-3 TaxID=2908211 RepID=UPI001F2B8ED3|nr:GTP-sensing pleiotropic transcriptional regulator CodY [Jeotgalibaca sp. MA1X17-3]UJF14780.1 GTP-sensing pleiotropic transcriptional regulator CodY [Jeotgalibaca sp. MA1X17-3]